MFVLNIKIFSGPLEGVIKMMTHLYLQTLHLQTLLIKQEGSQYLQKHHNYCGVANFYHCAMYSLIECLLCNRHPLGAGVREMCNTKCVSDGAYILMEKTDTKYMPGHTVLVRRKLMQGNRLGGRCCFR